MHYRAEIDGLRALAIIPVMLFHAGFATFSGGFVGVDVFFVISGYLITTIIVNDIESGRWSLMHFYERRARRILPALVVVTLTTMMTGWFLLNPVDLAKLGNAMIGVATFTANIVFAGDRGYFSEAGELNPLLHTWSLAVEEQFYIVFPVLLVLVWRLGKSRLLALMFVLSLMSLALSEWGWRNDPKDNFFLIWTRAWELLAGAMAAIIIQQRGVQRHDGWAGLGLAAILLSVAWFDETTPWPSLATMVPVLGTALLVVFAGREAVVGRILSHRFLVGIGLVSYSAYLWHQPLLAYSRHFVGQIDLPMSIACVALGLSLMLAYLTWRFIETPFRTKDWMSRRVIVGAGVAGCAAIMATGQFTRGVSADIEHRLALELQDSAYVYVTNIDERKFNAARLTMELPAVDTVVVGSSRLMQVGSRTIGGEALNLSVSGASIEDLVAFAGQATADMRPKRLLVGIDPWLFNQNAGQDRWQSIEGLYQYWASVFANHMPLDDAKSKGDLSSLEPEPKQNLQTLLYDAINAGPSLAADNGEYGLFGKKAQDGFLVSTIWSKPFVFETNRFSAKPTMPIG